VVVGLRSVIMGRAATLAVTPTVFECLGSSYEIIMQCLEMKPEQHLSKKH
jgi:hypothetical protein